MKRLLANLSFFLLLFIFISGAQATNIEKIALEKLIKESDLIVLAEVLKVDYPLSSRQAGKTQVKINKVIRSNDSVKANLTNTNLWLKMFHEIHDNNIDDKHAGEWLLFLKKNDAGEFKGASYGNSYFQVYLSKNNLNLCPNYLVYQPKLDLRSPLDTVLIPKELLTKTYASEEIMCLDKLMTYIQKL